MSVVTITAWRCDFPTCGHVWYTGKEPLRCAKCKRKNWNKTGGDVIKAPKTRKKRAPAKPVESKTMEIDGFPGSKVTSEVVDGVIQSITIENQGPLIQTPVTILPTIVHAPVAERFQTALKHIAAPEHKIGEKCKHGWANWLQCEKCNPKVAQ